MDSEKAQKLMDGCGKELYSYVNFDKNIELDTSCGTFEPKVKDICLCEECEAKKQTMLEDAEDELIYLKKLRSWIPPSNVNNYNADTLANERVDELKEVILCLHTKENQDE